MRNRINQPLIVLLLLSFINASNVFAVRPYVGASLNISRDNYSKDNRSTSDSSSLAKAFGVLRNSDFVSFKGSKSDFDLAIEQLVPQKGDTSRNDELKLSLMFNMVGGVQTLMTGGNPSVAIDDPAVIQQAVGNSYINYIKSKNVGFQFNFGTYGTPTYEDNRNTMAQILGSAVLSTIMPDRGDVDDLEDLTAAFVVGAGSVNNDIYKPVAAGAPGPIILQTIDINANDKFAAILAALGTTLEGLVSFTETLSERSELDSIANSGRGNAVGFSILGGLSENWSDFMLAGEVGLDFSNVKIGFSESNELNVKNNFGISVMGRAGYDFTKNFTSYLSAGFAFRNYDVTYNGRSVSFGQSFLLVPHFAIGVGAEFAINKNIGAFAELNYMTSLGGMKVAVLDQTVKVRSQILKLGARYYFGEKSSSSSGRGASEARYSRMLSENQRYENNRNGQGGNQNRNGYRNGAPNNKNYRNDGPYTNPNDRGMNQSANREYEPQVSYITPLSSANGREQNGNASSQSWRTKPINEMTNAELVQYIFYREDQERVRNDEYNILIRRELNENQEYHTYKHKKVPGYVPYNSRDSAGSQTSRY